MSISTPLRSLSPLPSPQAKAARISLDQSSWVLGWVFTVICLCGLMLNEQLGTTAIIIFLCGWAPIAVMRPQAMIRGLGQDAPMLLLPMLALLSTLWSRAPDWTAWAGTEFLGTTIIGLTLANCVPYRTLLSALLCVLTIMGVASYLDGSVNQVGLTGEIALVGLYGSKNAFALSAAVLTLVSAICLMQKENPPYLRFASILTALFSFVLLYLAKSIGAAVIALGSFLVIVLTRYLTTRRIGLRKLLIGVLVLGILLAIGLIGTVGIGDILRAVGKDPTLTGRTILWEAASHQIAQHPILGIGYQAFWQKGFPPAEALWTMMHIPIRAGFHFHNLYYHTLVDLGLVGLLLLIALLLRLAYWSVKLVMTSINDKSFFALGCFVFLLARSPLEVDLTFQFDLGTILFCLAWSYLRQANITQPKEARG